MQWSKEQIRNSKIHIEECKRALEEAIVSPKNNESLLKTISSDLHKAYKAEEELWRQMSRLLWLELKIQEL